MTFYDLVDEVVALLRQRGRVSYRALARQFSLDDARLDDLKFELIEVQGVAADQGGAILVWTGAAETPLAEIRADVPVAPGSVQAEPAPVDRGTASAPEATEAQRRQLSVLFCDLVGSTPLAAELDPEELRDVLRAYQSACAGAIERFGGVIARQVGDGLLVNFGYPLAHEDDAVRAVRAGLAIVAAMPALSEELCRRFPALEAHPLRVRIAVHTGLVVVGALGASTYRDPMAVVGDTPNIAARLQGLAAPGTVVVSGTTHRLLGDAFVCEDLGAHEIAGIALPVPVYRVAGAQATQEPAPASATTRMIPLIGREQEFGVLLERWEQSKEGLGQFVLLSGEAGIGKSRLVRELKARVAGEPHILLEGRGSSYHQQSAFYPWTDMLRRALHFDRGDSPEEKGGKLTAILREFRLPVHVMLPVFSNLLGLPAEPSQEASLTDDGHGMGGRMTPQRLRQQTMEALQGLVLLAARQPVLMIIEDLHWADPSTLEVLELLLEQASTARLLLVLTARPDFRVPPWGRAASMTWLTLSRLRRAQVERLVAAMTGGKGLPAEVVEQVAGKTDGVPLFVEELTKMVLESGLLREGPAGFELAGPLPPLAIPTTLQDSLMARLDRLAATKAVAQIGATLGRGFSYELLHAVAGLDEAALSVELGKLVEAELLYQRGLPPHATYSFKHALIQDAAYQTLLRSTRQQYHQRIARVLEAQFPDIVEAQPELLAHHYTEAGLVEHAVPYWQGAGQRAIERFANLEAIAHLTRGLELLGTLPATPEHRQQEIHLQTSLGPVLIVTRGQAAPEVERAYIRARELCRQVGETPQLFPVLWGLWYFYLARADCRASRELGDQLLGLARRVDDPTLRLLSHRALGQIVYFQGELAAARDHLEEGIALYDPERHRALALPFAQDPGVACHTWAALVLWALGYPDGALAHSGRALSLARESTHPYSLAYALYWSAWLHLLRREPQVVRERLQAATALSTEHGFAFWLANASILEAVVSTGEGEGAAGIARIREGLAGRRASGAEMWRAYWITLLAEAHGRVGQATEGLGLLAEAMAATESTGERCWEAESHRVEGELLLGRSRQGGSDGAESSALDAAACFERAIDVARGQRAKSLELRATMSLCRLWQGQGRTDEAHGRLAAIYGWFSEGFDTPDLEDAGALLAALK